MLISSVKGEDKAHEEIEYYIYIYILRTNTCYTIAVLIYEL